VVYPVGKHIGIRDLGPTRQMDFIKTVEYEREITGLHMSGYGNRRYLAISEKRSDNNIYLLIYDLKSNNYKQMVPKYQFNLCDLAYGHHGRREHKSDENTTRTLVSLNFSKDAKFLAAILTD
jgi:hypothetical protein